MPSTSIPRCWPSSKLRGHEETKDKLRTTKIRRSPQLHSFCFLLFFGWRGEGGVLLLRSYHEVVRRASILVNLQEFGKRQHVPRLDEYTVHAERCSNRDPIRVVAVYQSKRSSARVGGAKWGTSEIASVCVEGKRNHITVTTVEIFLPHICPLSRV